MTESTLKTVSEITAEIKNLLELRFRLVKVEGEMTNLKVQSSGHIYFSLKDTNAQISCAMFKGAASSLSFRPKSGDKVVVQGEISVYPPRGGYQIIVKSMKMAGVGELLVRLHALKNKLLEKGYFEKSKKLPLPAFPKTIGIITSPTGAVIQDIVNVITRRCQSYHLVLYPVKVQGDGAAEEIACAINEMNRYSLCDLLIVGRGGGSLEDLWPFNEECVADALFRSKIPTIAAVGHETDFSITDFVADVRAPTPSAAAEIAVKETASELKRLEHIKKSLDNALQRQITHLKSRLERYTAHPLFASPFNLLKIRAQKLDDIQMRLDLLSPKKRIGELQKTLSQKEQQLASMVKKLHESKKTRFKSLIDHLSSINPENLLKKGYLISFDEISGSVIMGRSQIKDGMKLRLHYHDGDVTTTAEQKV